MSNRQLGEELGDGAPPPVQRNPRRGNLEVFDFDPYSQALSKLQRGFELDLEDVQSMIASGQVDPKRLLELLDAIEPELFRFPPVDPKSLHAAVESMATAP